MGETVVEASATRAPRKARHSRARARKGERSASKKTPTSAPTIAATVGPLTDLERAIADEMLESLPVEWMGSKAYAEARGLSVDSVKKAAARASRHVSRSLDSDAMKALLVNRTREALDDARGNPHAVAKLVEPMGRLIGAIQSAGGATVNIALVERARAAAPAALGALQAQDRPAAIRAGLEELGVGGDALNEIAMAVSAALEPEQAIRGALEKAGLDGDTLDGVASHLAACVQRADAGIGERIGQAMSATPSVAIAKRSGGR